MENFNLRRTGLFALTCVLLFFTSCKSSINVFKGEKEVSGIPFYTKKAVLKQETKYLDKWIEITLSEVKYDKTTSVIHYAQTRASMDEVSALYAIFQDLKVSNNLEKINSKIKSYTESHPFVSKPQKNSNSTTETNDTKNKNTKEPTPKLIGNSLKTEVIVNYEDMYFLNGNMPWIGSTTIDQELNADGTLTKASVTSDSQIDELIAAAASFATPFASVKIAEIENKEDVEKTLEAIKRSGDKNVPFDELEKALKAKKNYQLKIEEKGLLYTFVNYHDKLITINTKKAIDFNTESGIYTVEEWPKKKVVSKPKDDKPTIGLSGLITLPKED